MQATSVREPALWASFFLRRKGAASASHFRSRASALGQFFPQTSCRSNDLARRFCQRTDLWFWRCIAAPRVLSAWKSVPKSHSWLWAALTATQRPQEARRLP